MHDFAVVWNLKSYPLDHRKVTNFKCQVCNQVGNLFVLGFIIPEATVIQFFLILNIYESCYNIAYMKIEMHLHTLSNMTFKNVTYYKHKSYPL